MLPDGSGLELVAAVREADGVAAGSTRACRCSAVSGRTGELDRIRGFERASTTMCASRSPTPSSAAGWRRCCGARTSARRSARLRVGRAGDRPAVARGAAARRARRAVAEGVRAAAGARRRARRGCGRRRSCSSTCGASGRSGSTRTLDSHACRLRQKLGRDGDRFVVNVWGVGYRLVDGPRPARRRVSTAAADWPAGSWPPASRRWARRRAAAGARSSSARACHELRGPLTAARLGLALPRRAAGGGGPTRSCGGPPARSTISTPRAAAAAPATSGRSSRARDLLADAALRAW